MGKVKVKVADFKDEMITDLILSSFFQIFGFRLECTTAKMNTTLSSVIKKIPKGKRFGKPF